MNHTRDENARTIDHQGSGVVPVVIFLSATTVQPEAFLQVCAEAGHDNVRLSLRGARLLFQGAIALFRRQFESVSPVLAAEKDAGRTGGDVPKA